MINSDFNIRKKITLIIVNIFLAYFYATIFDWGQSDKLENTGRMILINVKKSHTGRTQKIDLWEKSTCLLPLATAL